MISYVLVSDGSSDRCLIPIIDDAIERYLLQPSNGEWANFRELRKRPRSLKEKIEYCKENYEVSLIVVHRDAENDNDPLTNRALEIKTAINNAECDIPHIPCIPIRMSESWLLLDEKSIRNAASNPNGTIALNLPNVNRIEKLVDSKSTLYEKLKLASELSGRKLKKFKTNHRVHLVAEYIEDYSILEGLTSYRKFVEDLREVNLHGD